MTEWRVPGYTTLRPLGSGGFGDVVLARHDPTGVLVAIKYLRPDLLADPGFAQMFRSEAEALASLEDPHVVRLYEYVESPAGAAIVMELVSGVSLREILEHRGATTAEAALVVLEGSLAGLAAAHRRGVVHRDYKPENVLVTGDGASKLTDFGLAARSGERPVPAGTMHYVAPEQIAGAPASPAADVYSATATFYECLTGHPPFRGDTADLLRQHQSEPVPLDAVPEALRPLVTAGMAKDPASRPADATAFATELRAVATAAHGSGWQQHGRSHLGEAALLLAALWPAGYPAAARPAATVHKIALLRHLTPVKTAIAIGITAAAVAGGVAIAATVARHVPARTGNRPAAVHLFSLTPAASPTSLAAPPSPSLTPPSSSPSLSPPAPPPARSVTVTIPANGGWINTGLAVSPNDAVTIVASGSWTPAGPAYYTGPDGFGSSRESPDNYLNVHDLGVCGYCASAKYPEWAALVSYTGYAPPQPGAYTSVTVAPQTRLIGYVGSDLRTAAWPHTGELWLGINDDAYSGNISDNYGQVTAIVTVRQR